MLEDIRRRLNEYDETMNSLQIGMLESRDGVRFQVGEKIMDDEPLIKLSNELDDTFEDEEPTIALVSALANASRDKEMDQTKGVEPVLRNVEAIKRFMRSSRKNLNSVLKN
ncbi:hypothetical protein QVD17_16126 [Tagetes erecta]|uniref:Uncharacterized protein n=1 Tax=Tagetes erecta TaxID=13708 RepID=A0AAD8NT81_TARER|nr:hypothetical protein QVD17_16126 [Tagetes erecta]